MPLPPEVIADAFYGPDALFVDEIVEVNKEAGLIRARMSTSEDMPFTRSQVVDPVKHPRHVAGAVMVHVTGVLGFLHFYYVLGLRHADGWAGFGVRMHGVRFHRIAKIGPPLDLECRATKLRQLNGRILVRYSFEFRQEGELVYEGDQTAIWTQRGFEDAVD